MAGDGGRGRRAGMRQQRVEQIPNDDDTRKKNFESHNDPECFIHYERLFDGVAKIKAVKKYRYKSVH